MTWRYRLDADFHHHTPLLAGCFFAGDWLAIADGALTIPAGYAWDGCSPAWRLPGGLWLGTPDGPLGADGRPLSYRASLVHDALCQYAPELPIARDVSVAVFAELLAEAGFPAWRTRLYAAAVRRFGPQRWGGDARPTLAGARP